PNIVPFKDGRFVVVYETAFVFTRIADPLSGVKVLEREEFVARWTGDCLQLVPGEGLASARERLTSHRNPWRRIATPRVGIFAMGLAAVAALVAANGFAASAWALGLAAAASFWLVLFQAGCAPCNRAHQLAGALPLERVGTVVYA